MPESVRRGELRPLRTSGGLDGGRGLSFLSAFTVPMLPNTGIHPEMERLAILNRSMPSTACATMSNPAFRTPTVRQSLDWEKLYLMESSFSGRFCTSAHI